MTPCSRRFTMSSVVLAAIASAGTPGLCADDTPSIDYQFLAERSRWDFSDEADNPLFCMYQHAGTEYGVWQYLEFKDARTGKR